MYCSNCGTKLEANSQFCPNCGIKTAQSNYNNFSSDGNAKQKSKFIAGILAILLGSLGIHNFYLGYTSKGVAQLLMWVFWLGWVSFIWGIVEAIMIFTNSISRDAHGVPLADNF